MAADGESIGAAQGAALAEPTGRLLDELPCGYLECALDGRIVRVNRTLIEWTGRAADELVGRGRFQDLLTVGGRIYYETHYAPLLAMQGTVREIALDLVAAGGGSLPVIASSCAAAAADDRPPRVHTVLSAASHRREYERELLRARQRAESADRAKADFISTVSHEIRTPLHAIMAAGHLLESTPLSEAQQKYVRILRSSSEGLLALVDAILDFNRMEAGKLELDEKPFELRALLEEVAAGQRLRAERKGLELEVVVDPGCPERLVGDRVKIGQILANLIGNAVKFTERGSIRLEVLPRANDPAAAVLAFAVADTGIGIAADRLPHVFEGFTQASPEVASKYGGSGLGLAITRRLVELMGGELSVESEVGRGSTFSFALRLRLATPVPAGTSTVSADEPSPLAGVRVLLADDNEVNLVVLGDLLRGWGAEVDVVADGEAAVERVRVGGYDLVLMDLRMPKVDGLDAMRRIRALPEGARVPLVAVSATMRMGDAGELRRVGFDDFVGKPVDPDLLLAKIRSRLPARGAAPALTPPAR